MDTPSLHRLPLATPRVDALPHGPLDPALWEWMRYGENITTARESLPRRIRVHVFGDSLSATQWAYVDVLFGHMVGAHAVERMETTMTLAGWQFGGGPAPVALYAMLVDQGLLAPPPRTASRFRKYLADSVARDPNAPMQDFWLGPYVLEGRYYDDDAESAEAGDARALARMEAATAQLEADRAIARWRHASSHSEADPPSSPEAPQRPSMDVVYAKRAQTMTWLPKAFVTRLTAIDRFYRQTASWYHFAKLVLHVVAQDAGGEHARRRLVELAKTAAARWNAQTLAAESKHYGDSRSSP